MTVYCAECQLKLDEPAGTPHDKRGPCPNCGSAARRLVAEVTDAVVAVDTVRTTATVHGASVNVTVAARPGMLKGLPVDDSTAAPARDLRLYEPSDPESGLQVGIVYDTDGTPLTIVVGDNGADILLELAQDLLPPDNQS